jgi:hypothetical protein
MGGTTTATNNSGMTQYVTALGAVRATNITLNANGSILIEGGTTNLESASTLSATSALLLAETSKKLTTTGAGSVVVKGGTANVNPALGSVSASNAQALGLLDPSDLTLDIGGSLVLQGGIGTGPSGSVTAARIDAGGNILITTHGATAYTFSDTQIGLRSVPGGAIIIGGTGSGIFDAANIPLSGGGPPIQILTLGGGTLTKVLDRGRDDAVIQTGRNVFDSSLLNYVIFAANDAATARRLRRGTSDDEVGGAAACQ